MTIMPESSIYKGLKYLDRSGHFYSQKFTLFKKNAIMTPGQLCTNNDYVANIIYYAFWVFDYNIYSDHLIPKN